MLSREAILSAQDLRHKDVDVPEWGGTVRVRMMTGAERDEFERLSYELKADKFEVNTRNVRARLVAMSVVDESGNLLFGVDDIEALGKKSARALDRVFAVAQKLNAVSKSDIDELAKN